MTTQISFGEVFNRMAGEGIDSSVPTEAVAKIISAKAEEAPLPWYVRLFVGIAAWIAAILIVVFLFIVEVLDDIDTKTLIFGLVFCAIAILINRFGPRNTFLEQLALAISLTGQVLAGVVIFEMSYSYSSGISYDPYFPTIVLELIIIALHRNSVLRFISTIIITSLIVGMIFDKDIVGMIHVFTMALAVGTLLIFISEYHLISRGLEEITYPVVYGMILSFFALLTTPASAFSTYPDYNDFNWDISAIGILILLAFLTVYIARGLGYRPFSKGVVALLITSALLLVPGIRVPGILGALLMLALGFWRGHRVLIGISTAFLVYYISTYYYSLDWTLLVKSLSLMAIGILFLALRYFLARFTKGETA